MVTWIILLVFGVPAFVVIRDAIRSKKEYERKLRDTQRRIFEKNENAIEDRMKAIKLKRDAQKNKDGHV